MTKRAGALAVAAGILLSRVAGLVRERAFAHYLGNGPVAGVFRAAMRIPNLVQNLLGEGVVSGSFIPVYAKLLGEGREAEAARVAGFVGASISFLGALLVAVGVTMAGPLVALVSPGYAGSEHALTVELVRWLFISTGLLVPSAWCLGVLNSHRRFFLPYVAPVLWNLAQIGALVGFASGRVPEDIARTLAWGVVAGSAAQLLVQLPQALRLARPRWGGYLPEARRVVTLFVPTLVGRGVVQISAYIDLALASWLGASAVSSLGYAQLLYLLPVSLFGMAISAAELPEMARAGGAVKERLAAARRRMIFFVAPTTVAFIAIGDVVVATLFQTGRFHGDDAQIVWGILAAQAVGLVATTEGRLLASTAYAMGEARVPLRTALVRLSVSAGFGAAAVFGLSSGWQTSAMALVGAGSVAAWVERLLLGAWIRRRVGPIPREGELAVWAAAVVAGGAGFGLHRLVTLGHPLLDGAVVLGAFGLVYLAVAAALGRSEAQALLRGRRPR